MAKLLHVLVGADMRCRQNGLIGWLKVVHKIDLEDLSPGDMIVMLNNKKSYLALIAILPEKESYQFVGYYKSPHGRVPLDALKYIANSIGSSGFNMNAAIRKGLEEILGAKRIRGN